MPEFRRERNRWTNLVGGVWVFVSEALIVGVAVVLALLVALLVLWVV